MTNATALITSLGSSVRTVLQDMSNFIAVITSGLVAILGTVPCNVSSREAAIASVVLVLTVLGEVAVPGALVALQAPTQPVVPGPGVRHHLLSPQHQISLVLLLRTVSGEVSGSVAPAEDSSNNTEEVVEN